MSSKLAEDPRIDPRIKETFAGWEVRPLGDVASREDLLAVENSDTGKAATEALRAFSTLVMTRPSRRRLD